MNTRVSTGLPGPALHNSGDVNPLFTMTCFDCGAIEENMNGVYLTAGEVSDKMAND
jgi:hypothetical protein